MSLLRAFSWRLALVLAVGLGLRLAAAAVWQQGLPAGERFGFGDSASYWHLGAALAEGEAYEYGSEESRVFRTPGFPLILAGLFRVAGGEPPVFWGRVVTALLATAAVGGVFWLGQQLFDKSTGLVAALLAAVYPEAIISGALLLSEAPFSALLPVQLVCWHKGSTATTPRASACWLLAAGVTAGLATLVRPSWLLFTPFALGLAILFSSERRRHLRAAPWLMAGLIVTLLPWWVRNYQTVGVFVPTTLQVGVSLYDGLSPTATGASDMEFVPQLAAELRARELKQPDQTGAPWEVRLDRFARGQSLAWAREHPAEVARLAGVKFTRMWNVWPNEPQFRRPLFGVVLLVSYVPVLLLSLVGVWRFARRGWSIWLCVLPAVYLTLLHLVFVSSLRYRQPALLPLMVLAAAALVYELRARGWMRPAEVPGPFSGGTTSRALESG